MDRCESFSANGGPLAAELSAALYQARGSARVIKIVYGLNGRDYTVADARQVFADLEEVAADKNSNTDEYRYIGLRE